MSTLTIKRLRSALASYFALAVLPAAPGFGQGLVIPKPEDYGITSCVQATRAAVSDTCDFVNPATDFHDGGTLFTYGFNSWEEENARVSACNSACQNCCDDLDPYAGSLQFIDATCRCVLTGAGGLVTGGVTAVAAGSACAGAIGEFVLSLLAEQGSERLFDWVRRSTYKEGPAPWHLGLGGALGGAAISAFCTDFAEADWAAYLDQCSASCDETYRFDVDPPRAVPDPCDPNQPDGQNKSAPDPIYPGGGHTTTVTANLPPGLPPLPPDLGGYNPITLPTAPGGLTGGGPQAPDCFGICCPQGGGGGGGSPTIPQAGCTLDGMPVACSSLGGLFLY